MINGLTQFNTTQLAQTIGGATAASVAARPLQNIADFLSSSEGFANGTLGGALEAQVNPAGNAVSVPNPGSVLAGALNPSINLSPSTTLQVTDFVNANQNAFPTQAPAPPPPPPPTSLTTDNSGTNANAASASSNNNNNAPSTDNTPAPAAPNANTSTPDNTTASAQITLAASLQSNLSPADIYSAIANVNASTIRGTSVNTSA